MEEDKPTVDNIIVQIGKAVGELTIKCYSNVAMEVYIEWLTIEGKEWREQGSSLVELSIIYQ